MSDTSLEQTESPPPSDGEPREYGDVGISEVQEPAQVVAPAPSADVTPVPAAAQQRSNRSATIEHLAARRAVSELKEDDPEVKQKLSDLRTELTTLVTNLRWGGVSTSETAKRMIPLLNHGPLTQWIPLLVPTILEIDRAGNMIPVWLQISERADPLDLLPEANPAETMIGRARRIALLMLGHYKTPEISEALGKFAVDSSSSLYATRSLVKQSTVAAMQALARALKDAEGWAKVDIIDAYATMDQARFYDLMLASGLERANGLESYIAVPLYRKLPIETYLRGGSDVAPRLSEQAAMVVFQVAQDSLHNAGTSTLPILFERDLPTVIEALFTGARTRPNWGSALALHRLGLLLGRYWTEIARGAIADQYVVQSVYAAAPMMPEIERWMNNTGRNALLEALGNSDEAFSPCLRVLNELREPRIADALIQRLNRTERIISREHAILLGRMCDALVQQSNAWAGNALLDLIRRVVNVEARSRREKRRENLATGDTDLPTSIVYASALRALGQLKARDALDTALRATRDFDPYVRTQAIDALKGIDPAGENPRSHAAAREALNDPRDTVVRAACQLLGQYKDREAISALEVVRARHPELANYVQDALQKINS